MVHIYHTKSFKMKYIRPLYLHFLLKYLARHLKVWLYLTWIKRYLSTPWDGKSLNSPISTALLRWAGWVVNVKSKFNWKFDMKLGLKCYLVEIIFKYYNIFSVVCLTFLKSHRATEHKSYTRSNSSFDLISFETPCVEWMIDSIFENLERNWVKSATVGHISRNDGNATFCTKTTSFLSFLPRTICGCFVVVCVAWDG